MTFEDFAQFAAAQYGCRCTTVLLHHSDDAERLYSSDPDFVSPVGRKRFADAPAMAQMKAQAQPQKFEGEAEILAMFREGQKLVDTGFLCLLNLPIKDESATLQGQVNLAMPEGTLGEDGVAILSSRAQLLLPEMLRERATRG